MALNYNDLKQVFFEEENEQKERQRELDQAKKELEQAKLELARAKEQRQKEQQQARLEILQAREERARETERAKQQQADKQNRFTNITYIISLLITFGGLVATVILFIFILLKG